MTTQVIVLWWVSLLMKEFVAVQMGFVFSSPSISSLAVAGVDLLVVLFNHVIVVSVAIQLYNKTAKGHGTFHTEQ